MKGKIVFNRLIAVVITSFHFVHFIEFCSSICFLFAIEVIKKKKWSGNNLTLLQLHHNIYIIFFLSLYPAFCIQCITASDSTNKRNYSLKDCKLA